MKKIKYIVIVCFILLGFTNCQEDKLSPSHLDVDRVETLLDWSNSVVKRYYEDYGVAILTEFDKNLDLRFDFLSQEQGALIAFWDRLDVGKMTRKTECDSAITVLDTAVFKYFKDEIVIEGKTYYPKFKEKYFPNKVLIANKLESAENVFGLIMQTVNRPSSTGVGASYFQSNDNAVVVNLESEMLHTDRDKFNRVTKSILFCMIAYAFDKYDLYKQVPQAFYGYSKPYYDKRIDEIQNLEGEDAHGISRQEYVDKYKMVCTSVAPTANLNGFLAAMSLPSPQEDVKAFIDHLINPETINGNRWETVDEYGNLLSPYVWKWNKEVSVKMWYIARTLMKLGIDVLAINQDPIFHQVVNRTQEDIESIQ